MTSVTVESVNGLIVRLASEGHADYADEGEDIVCAAVSVLMFTCINALESVAGVKVLVKQSERKALLEVSMPQIAEEAARHDAQVILRATVQGLTDVSQEYPKFVKLNIFDGRNKP